MKLGKTLVKRRYPEGETIAKAEFGMVVLNMLKGISVFVGLPADALPWITAVNNAWFKDGDKRVGVLKSKYLGPLEAKGYVTSKPVPGTRSRQVCIEGLDAKVTALLKEYEVDDKTLARHWGKDALAAARLAHKTAPLLAPDKAVCPACEGEVDVVVCPSAESPFKTAWRPYCAACELQGKLATTPELALDPWRARVLGERA